MSAAAACAAVPAHAAAAAWATVPAVAAREDYNSCTASRTRIAGTGLARDCAGAVASGGTPHRDAPAKVDPSLGDDFDRASPGTAIAARAAR
jgi:hypothetical protein